MISCVIIDDEPQAQAAIKQELKFHCPHLVIKGVGARVHESVELIKRSNPDIVFLDISLSDGVGFDVLEKIKEHNFNVIFTTAYSEYALKAIKFNALDYLLKPIDGKELKLAVEKAEKRGYDSNDKRIQNYLRNNTLDSGEKRIALRTSQGSQLVELNNIVYCQADGNYTKIIFTKQKEILLAKTLKEFELLLSGDGFERIHISHLINLKHLLHYRNQDGGKVEMSDGSLLPVSQRKKARLLEIIKSFNE